MEGTAGIAKSPAVARAEARAQLQAQARMKKARASSTGSAATSAPARDFSTAANAAQGTESKDDAMADSPAGCASVVNGAAADTLHVSSPAAPASSTARVTESKDVASVDAPATSASIHVGVAADASAATTTDVGTSKGRIKKGRGFATKTRSQRSDRDHFHNRRKEYDVGGPLRSVEGYVVFVSGVHEEAKDDDIHDAFADFGAVINLHLNLDRETGFAKGYALVEYSSYKEALEAIKEMDGSKLLGLKLSVGWAFARGPAPPGRR